MDISTPEVRDLDAELYNPTWDDPRYLADIARLKERAHETESSEANQEEASRQKEANDYLHRSERMAYQDEVTRVRHGRIIHEREFLRMLQQLSGSFKYGDAVLMGRRVLCDASGPIETIQAGYMKEWDELRTNEYGVATDLRFKGWRTVLMNLVLRGVVREVDVDRVFGSPSGPDSTRYRRTLWCFRNRRCGICEKRNCQCEGRYEYLRADSADKF